VWTTNSAFKAEWIHLYLYLLLSIPILLDCRDRGREEEPLEKKRLIRDKKDRPNRDSTGPSTRVVFHLDITFIGIH